VGSGYRPAISDFIVVHDRAWKIVRTNRSLADHLGLPPVALVGEAVHSLHTLAEGDGTLAVSVLSGHWIEQGRATSSRRQRGFIWCRPHAPAEATEDDARTIHVLKRHYDRREAERRYRELYDSIQEGLFFLRRRTEDFWT